MFDRKKESKKVSRSVRLKKYEAAYKACLKKALSVCEKKKSPKKKRKPRKSKVTPVEKPKKSKDKKRSLNNYQIFVREESKKSKYKGMIPSNRMRAIGKAWKALK